jgi:oligopeptide/dipeptide ABC transporter ATP-binding protein
VSLLDVANLTSGFDADGRTVLAVQDVSFQVGEGETLALVGESGSGKSMTALSIMRLLPPLGRILAGSIRFQGRDLLTLAEPEMRALRGAQIALIFQEPMTALNPVLSVGDQIAETLVVHGRAEWPAARAEAVQLMDAVKIPNAARRAQDYPHQLSGGQRQRVMIAIALACRPALVIADEPTTALDVTIQAEILDLLQEMKTAFGLSLLLITHDLGIVAQMAERVLVMYAGRIVEEAPVSVFFQSPQHPYSRGLLVSLPRRGGRSRRLRAIEGTVPSPAHLPPGCAFEPRCPERLDACGAAVPELRTIGENRSARCIRLEAHLRQGSGGQGAGH